MTHIESEFHMIIFISFIIVLCLKVLFYGLIVIWSIVIISEILHAVVKFFEDTAESFKRRG